MFVTCQPGAEGLLKSEIAHVWGERLRLSFSRPGFVTFKMSPEVARDFRSGDFALRSAFAREYGLSLNKIKAEKEEERVAAVVAACNAEPFAGKRAAVAVHARDAVANAGELTARLIQAQSASFKRWSELKRGDLVLDVVWVEHDEWWLGWHRHSQDHRPWPGGVATIELPPEAPSRAYLKLCEGLEWPGLAVQAGETALELGSSPGGASFALLEKGLNVLGVDPGEMAPQVLAHPKFRHLKTQARQLTLDTLGPIHWVISDMNIGPSEAIDAVAWVVQRLKEPQALKGVLITLKLTEWKDAKKIPKLLEDVVARARALGFADAQVGQLYFNRLELCLAGWAARNRSRS